ncbi:MAG: flagellar biosynthesis anti-sigma factor FlgM [Phycisphaerae bacterium]|nr:flagellar biosynthesis anti-sigma factor FlgM [Phycisphaerae bacterium]
MPTSESREHLEIAGYTDECFIEQNLADDDLLIEQILDNVNNTPLGKVIKRIASLPEVRRRKILDLRRSLANGNYEVNNRLDIALDRVLEELTS